MVVEGLVNASSDVRIIFEHLQSVPFWVWFIARDGVIVVCRGCPRQTVSADSNWSWTHCLSTGLGPIVKSTDMGRNIDVG